MVTVSIRSVDGIDESFDFDTLHEAWHTINHYLGSTWDHGSSYAVNMYGDVRVTLDGATWDEYKAIPKKQPKEDYPY